MTNKKINENLVNVKSTYSFHPKFSIEENMDILTYALVDEKDVDMLYTFEFLYRNIKNIDGLNIINNIFNTYVNIITPNPIQFMTMREYFKQDVALSFDGIPEEGKKILIETRNSLQIEKLAGKKKNLYVEKGL